MSEVPLYMYCRVRGGCTIRTGTPKEPECQDEDADLSVPLDVFGASFCVFACTRTDSYRGEREKSTSPICWVLVAQMSL